MVALLPSFATVGCAKKGGGDRREETGSTPSPSTGSALDRGAEGGGGAPGGPMIGGAKGGADLDAILAGDLEISVGSMGKDTVRKVMKDHVSKLQYCYEQTLLANPGIEGRVMAKFTIDPQGSVENVKCAGVHPDVESCVEKAVKDMKFPPQANKVEVQYPFTFKPA
jgi:TonB family protein